MIWHHIHCILRPNPQGQWYVQDDIDHASCNIHPTLRVQQDADALRLYFNRDYHKTGTIQITPDDGFGGGLTANASLGVGSARIEMRAWPLVCGFHAPINPAHVWSKLDAAAGRAVPRDNGNLWVNVIMGLEA